MSRYLPALSLLLVAVVLIVGFSQRKGDPLSIIVDGDVAYLNGVTNGRSEGAVREMLRDHPQVERLILMNMPGTEDVISNIRLARSIREAKLTTQLLPESRIASGAVDLFLAGQMRISHCRAMIGVHAWGSSGYDAQDVGWDTHRGFQRNFLADMGLDPDFYDFRTQAAGRETIHWMSVEDINRWGLTTTPLECN